MTKAKGETGEAGESAGNENAAMTAAEIAAREAQEVAEHDAAVLAREAEEEAALKAEAAAMAQGEANGGETVDPILFDTAETGVPGSTLATWVRNPGGEVACLIFGANGQSLAQLVPHLVTPRDFTIDGARIVWSGHLKVLGDASLGAGLRVDSVALASGPDGPVLAVCEIAGGVMFGAGLEFQFGPGAFVFG